MMRYVTCFALLLAIAWSAVCNAQPVDVAAPQPNRSRLARPDALLSLAKLESLALTYNPALDQTAANIHAAQGQARQAGLYPNPALAYMSEEIGVEGTAGFQGAGVQQTIVTAGKLGLRRDVFLYEADRAHWNDQAQRMRVVNGVRQRYYDLLYLERLVDLRTRLLKTARDLRETATQLKNNGKLNRSDELLAIIEARQAEVRLARAQNDRRAAWRELAAFIGAPELSIRPLAGNLDEPRGRFDETENLQRLLAAHPLIHSAAAHVARRQAAVRREIAEVVPDVDVQAGTQYSFETNDQVALVNIGLRLPIFNRNQGNIAAAEAELRRANAELREIELALRGRHAEAFARYQTAQTQVDSYRIQLNDATEAFGLYQEAFATRMASYQQVLIAQRTYFEIIAALNEAHRDLRQAEVELEGMLLTEVEADLSRRTPLKSTRIEYERD